MVHLGRERSSGEFRALKTVELGLTPDDDEVERLSREIDILRGLDHEHIVALRDWRRDDGHVTLIMEYCAGGTLEDLLAENGGPLTVSEALCLMGQLLSALTYTHDVQLGEAVSENGDKVEARGITHRDIKPTNILFKRVRGDEWTLKLADFGLAKAFGRSGSSGLTETGSFGGSLSFICRQQFVNYKYAKPEVDVWAAAACLYFALTGHPPRDVDARKPIESILEQNPVPIRKRNPAVPEDLATVIDAALNDDVELKHKTAGSFQTELESHLPSGGTHPPRP